VATAKKPKAPASVEALVEKALTTAATKPKAKWSGASGSVLFNSNEANTEAAIAAATKGDVPVLVQRGETWALTAAGFVRVASDMSAEAAAQLAKGIARGLTAEDRVAFLEGVIGRTPAPAAELVPVLEVAVQEAKAEQEGRVALTAKRAVAHAANVAALERALALCRQAKQDRLEAIRREWEAEGQRAADLPPPTKAREPEPELRITAKKLPVTNDDKAFRRDSADQFAASWRAAFDGKKAEAMEFVESAMWNIAGLKLMGEVGARVGFDPRYHECATPTSSGQPAVMVRPGWVLEETTGDYVALKAVVKST
jgi:hypothetical protein